MCIKSFLFFTAPVLLETAYVGLPLDIEPSSGQIAKE
jgi:hypothetical protein